MIVKVHGLGMGDSMVIKTDEIKTEIMNYIKTKYDNNIISINSHSKPSPQSNNYTIKKRKNRWRHMQAQPVI